jgi:hypothetical protein
MNQPTIERTVAMVTRRYRRYRLWRNLAAVWLAIAAGVWLVWLAVEGHRVPWSRTSLVVVAGAAAVVVAIATWRRRIDPRWVAREIERAHPDLDSRLLAAYEQERTISPTTRSFLADAVIAQAQIHAVTHRRWTETVPSRRLWAWSAAQWSTFAMLAATLFFVVPGRATSGTVAVGTNPPETTVAELPPVEIEPGDVELERGTDLLALARFVDRARLPQEAVLVVVDATGERRFPAQQSLQDPLFAVRVPEVRADLAYTFDFDGSRTREFRATVFDYPELERADAELTYPAYTGLSPKRIEDVRQLTVPEGTELRLVCRLNKSVTAARLVPAAGDALPLTATSDDSRVYSHAWRPTADARLRLELRDDRDRANRESVEFIIDVVPNRAPDLKLVFPRQDVKISPLQELALEAEAVDDFGIVRWGVEYELTGRKPQTATFGEKALGGAKQIGSHLVALESLSAKPDDLMAWHVWAEDLAADGSVRRTTSDIFFAEVSPFDEVFRQMSADGAPGKGQPKPADEGLKLQKQVITATWNLRRRESSPPPSDKFASDADVIAQAQRKALAAVQEMKEKLKAPEAAAIVAQIEADMQAAEKSLLAAAAANDVALLNEALPAEQAAYQGLLKLRARETRITKSKSAQGQGGQQSAAGQNLDQLELKEEDERYETRNRAGDAAQTPAQREQEEFLNRLRELARRQEDLNQKIKELQAALEAAKNEVEKQQIERQLKRLRDEQREMLRDVDGLKNKLDKPQHNAPQAQASKQLDKTRENVRQASEALEKGKPSEALTAGTRAESELDQLREDFRKQTAGRFTEELRDLVDRARQLDERQRRVGDELAGKPPAAAYQATAGKPQNGKPEQAARNDDGRPGESDAKPERPAPRRGLRSTGESPTKLADELRTQQKELHDVLDKAREITERAEGNEPVVTKQLYDTLRRTHQQQTERAVEMMQQLVEHGLPTEAAKVEPQARQGLQQLREGIEKAAEGVLGDDVEGLRRAKREVDRLAQALAEEMKRETGRGPSPEGKPADGDKATGDKPTSGAKPQATDQPGGGKKPDEGGKTGDAKSGEAKSNPGDQPRDGENGGEKSAEGKNSSSKQPQQGGQGQGSQPGKENGSQESEGNQPEEGKPSGADAKPGSPSKSGEGQSAGDGKPGKSSNGGAQPAQSPRGDGSQPTDNTPGGEQPGSQEPSQLNAPQHATTPQPGRQVGQTANATGGGGHSVLTGPDWREWSDALRNVEEYVPGVRLRADAARVREQAQALRAEAKRHSKNPNWELVRETVYEPLIELQRQLNEELTRRESPDAAVPLDRDPVPDRFGEAVRKYYERLGSGQ